MIRNSSSSPRGGGGRGGSFGRHCCNCRQFTLIVLSTLIVLCMSTFYFILFASHFLESTTNNSNAGHSTQSTRIDNNDAAIFYNIYVPPGDDLSVSRSAIRIVAEQMNERKQQKLHAIPVFYTLIGNTNVTKEVQEACGENCRMIQRLDSGSEVSTLQRLYDYCSIHSEATVTYLHNKGSLHPTPQNRKLRALITKSTFTSECQGIGIHNEQQEQHLQCNVCGARFSPFPHIHIPGNMWTAKCQYVSKLIPPINFETEMDNLMDYVFKSSDKNIPKPSIEQVEAGYFVGLKRFASEHWIGSHPYVQPCDVYPGKYLAGYIDLPSRSEESTWTPDLQEAPRYPVSIFQKRAPPSGEWFCGQARLIEFNFLYGRLPIPNFSWVWKFYNERFKSCLTPLELKQKPSSSSVTATTAT